MSVFLLVWCLSLEGITEKESFGNNPKGNGNEKFDGLSSHFSHRQYYTKEGKNSGGCFSSENISQFPEKTNTELNEKSIDLAAPSSNETSKCLFYETQLEIYFGFIGFQVKKFA
jgi:hypothetical protein